MNTLGFMSGGGPSGGCRGLAPGRRAAGACRGRAGFTLIEMLVVIGIIVVLALLALPNLRGFREGNETEAAARQLMQDLSLARARAINGRTTVAMVFIPRSILSLPLAGYSPAEAEEIKNRQAGVYTDYALFCGRRVGDQPGRSTPRYLTEWRSLPEKTFIATNKFFSAVGTNRFLYAPFPFPFAQSRIQALPYVAFNHEGRLCRADGSPLSPPGNIRIPLARGAILYTRDANNAIPDGNLIVQEVPPGNSLVSSNVVVLDWLTGRPHNQRAELQSLP